MKTKKSFKRLGFCLTYGLIKESLPPFHCIQNQCTKVSIVHIETKDIPDEAASWTKPLLTSNENCPMKVCPIKPFKFPKTVNMMKQ